MLKDEYTAQNMCQLVLKYGPQRLTPDEVKPPRSRLLKYQIMMRWPFFNLKVSQLYRVVVSLLAHGVAIRLASVDKKCRQIFHILAHFFINVFLGFIHV